MDKKKCSIIVLNHNGRDLLDKFLPSILRAAGYDNAGHEVILVDNGSTDDSPDHVRKNFSSVKVISLPDNRHMEGYNIGVRESKNDVVLLLNNDIEVERGFIEPLLSHFTDPDVFAVRPTVNVMEDEKINETRGSQIGAHFKFGFIEYLYRKKSRGDEFNSAHITFCAPGGAGAFDKKKFLQLDGFDDLFAPFYWEDVDLSYRAWKRGWKVIYEPKSSVCHYTHSTVGKIYNDRYVGRIAHRNRFLLVWKNITDGSFLIQHFCCIPLRLIVYLLKGKPRSILAFFSALKLLGLVRAKRRRERVHAKFSDREIFGFFNHVRER